MSQESSNTSETAESKDEFEETQVLPEQVSPTVGGSNEPEDASEKTPDSIPPKKNRRKLYIIGGAIIAAALIATGVGVGFHIKQVNHDNAVAACADASKAYSSAVKDYGMAVVKAAADTKGIDANGVADAKTFATYQSDVKTSQATVKLASDNTKVEKTVPLTLSCDVDASTNDLNAVVDQVNAKTTSVKAQSVKLSKDAKAVVASRDVKALSDAKKALADQITAAQGTLDTTGGKVADDTTRAALTNALNEANEVAKNTKATTTQLTEQAKKLTDSVNGVNASVQAKTQADQAAAAAAAAAQARKSTSTGSSSSSKKTYTSSGSTAKRSTGSGGSGGSSSAGSSSGSGLKPHYNLGGGAVDTKPEHGNTCLLIGENYTSCRSW